VINEYSASNGGEADAERAAAERIQEAKRERDRALGPGEGHDEQVIREGEKAKEQLVLSVERLMISLVNRYVLDDNLKEDCDQEARIALLKSVDRFDPRYRFSTFAFQVIKKSIYEFLKREGPNSRRDGPLGSGPLAEAENTAAERAVQPPTREHKPQRASVKPKPRQSVYKTRLERAMAEMVITEDELVRETGRSPRTIQLWCAGEVIPRDPRDKDVLQRKFGRICSFDHLFDPDVVAEVARNHGPSRDPARPYGDEYFPSDDAPLDDDVPYSIRDDVDDDAWLNPGPSRGYFEGEF
jgi:RNA polymerase sigma factor (sigma-70 family)